MKSNKFYQFKTLFFLLLMMLVASCSNEMEFENTPAPDNWDGEIVLSMSSNLGWGANSRSESSETTVEDIKAFFQDKCLFMFITANEQNTSLMNEVIGLQYSDDGFKFGNYEKGEDGILAFTTKEGYVPKYPQDSGMDLYFVAISKYSELPVLQEGNALPTINHKISANQKDSNADSDLLYASVKNQSKTATPIVLNFKHLLSKVSIAYQPEEYEGKLVNAVFLENCYDAVNLNLTAGTISNSGTETSIRIRTQRTDDFNAPQYCEAYVAPATYAANSTFIKFCYNYNEDNKTSGKVVSYDIPTGETFESGHQYKYHMEVKRNGDIVMKDPTLYIYGSAISEKGYALPVDEAQKMTYNTETGEYSWTGNISNSGDFKFTCQSDAYWPGYVKGADVDGKMTADYFQIYETQDDPKFTVDLNGNYTVTFKKDVDNNYVTIKANSLQPIYLAGTNFGWLNEAKEMTYSNGVFTYTQETNSFNDTFRFLCNKDAYWPAYSKADVNDNTKAKYRETAVGDEFNFNLYVAAESHTISLNINTLEVTITATNVKPLYLFGTSTSSSYTAISYDEASKKYTAQDVQLSEGDLKLSCQSATEYPAYCQGENSSKATYVAENGTAFNVPYTGTYDIQFDPVTMDIMITEKEVLKPLYIVGDALQGYDPTLAILMDEQDGVYTYTGEFVRGGFRFICQNIKDQWWPGYANIDGSAKYFENYEGLAPDFDIYTKGNYTITFDSNKETDNVSIVSNRIDPVYLIGDATPNGWSTGNPTSMKNIAGTYSFEWNGNLTTNNQHDLRFICQAVEGQYWPGYAKATDSSVTYIHSNEESTGKDIKFEIGVASEYYVYLNTENLEAKINRIPNQLWMIGDASDAGWNFSEMLDMTKDGMSYKITTNLKAGTFRFSLAGKDNTNWGIEYINAPSDNCQITGTSSFKLDYEQYNWKVEEGQAGNYTITLDFKTYTISFQKNN